jgi:hypothetical protein
VEFGKTLLGRAPVIVLPRTSMTPTARSRLFDFGRGGINLVLFLAAFAAMGAALGSLTPFPEVPIITEKLRLLQTKHQESDVIFFGSSRVMHQIDPAAFEAATAAAGVPVRAFNFGVDSMWPPESLFVLRELLKHPAPKMKWVFIELMHVYGTLQDGQDESARVFYWHDRHHTNLAQKAVLEREATWSNRLLLLWRHERLWLKHVTHFGEGSQLFRKALLPDEKTQKASTWAKHAGYRVAPSQALGGETRQKFERTLNEYRDELQRQRTPLPESLRAEYHPIVAALRARGAEPVFFISPGFDIRDNYREAPGGARLISFSRPDLYPELFCPDHSCDLSHLNRTGAALYTSHLARFFLEINSSRKK